MKPDWLDWILLIGASMFTLASWLWKRDEEEKYMKVRIVFLILGVAFFVFFCARDW